MRPQGNKVRPLGVVPLPLDDFLNRYSAGCLQDAEIRILTWIDKNDCSNHRRSSAFLETGALDYGSGVPAGSREVIYRRNQGTYLRLPGGGGGGSNPLGFSWITSVALQVSTQNLVYLSLHQFNVPTYRKFWKIFSKSFWIMPIKVTQCHAVLFRKLVNVGKITKNRDLTWYANKSTKRRRIKSSFKWQFKIRISAIRIF